MGSMGRPTHRLNPIAGYSSSCGSLYSRLGETPRVFPVEGATHEPVNEAVPSLSWSPYQDAA
jgi:hypothetical protein